MILQVGWIVPPSLTAVLAFGARRLVTVLAGPENRLLPPYFREDKLSHGADSTELAHVQMGNDPIAAFKPRPGQHDLQPSIARRRIVVKNSDTCTATNRFELTNSRRTFKPAINGAIKLGHEVELVRE